MNREDLVSVIIPLYNAEKTIGRCLQSVMNQSYENLEIILADDGSTDESVAICREYGRTDSRIRILQQSNSGPGVARNLGIDGSNGAYIAFVDSDDYIEPDMIEKMLKAIQDSGAEIAVCGFYLEKPGKEPSPHTFHIPSGVYEGESWLKIARRLLSDNSPTRIPPYSWLRMIQKSVLEHPRLRYTSGIIRSEDYLFLSELNFRVNKAVLLLDQPLYHYVENEGSITHRYVEGYWDMVKKIHRVLSARLPKEAPVQEKLNVMVIQRALIAFHNSAMSGKSAVVEREIGAVLSDPVFLSAIRSLGIRNGVREFRFFYMMVLLHMKRSIIRHFKKEIKPAG